MTDQTKAMDKAVKELFKFLQKQGLKEKDAVCHDKRIAFCRGDQLKSLFSTHKSQIPSSLLKFIEEDLGPDYNSLEVIQWMIDNKFILRLERDESEAKKYKWPKKLLPSQVHFPLFNFRTLYSRKSRFTRGISLGAKDGNTL